MKQTLGNKSGKLDLNLVLFIILMAGMALKYVYVSTIGNLESLFSSEMGLWVQGLSIFAVFLGGSLLDFGIGGGFKGRAEKPGLGKLFNSSTVSGLLLLLIMTSFMLPPLLFMVAAVVLAIGNRLKITPSAMGLGTYFLIVGLSYWQMDEIPYLTAPYLYSLAGGWDDFRRQFHSVTVVAAGMTGGPLSFSLLLPMLAGGVMLANRKFGPMLWSLLYLFVFWALSFLYIGMSQWRLPLFLLNGSVVASAVFFLPMELNHFKLGASKGGYIVLLGISTFIFSYYINFIWGAYLALLGGHFLLQIGTFLDKKGNKG